MAQRSPRKPGSGGKPAARPRRGLRSSVRPAAAVHIEVVMQAPDAKPPVKSWLARQFARIAALAGVVRGRVTLLVVDDAEMARLHQQYKNEPGTTDVLTFDLRESPGEDVDGDIALCLDEAARQAKARGHLLRLELLLYAVHGLLHLSGYDDRTRAEYERMHQREDELLKAAGLGAVFRR